MHEFSTALGIVETVKRVAKDHGATRVISIHLQVGDLTLLNHDQLRFGIEVASQGTIAEGAEVVIEALPVRIVCKQCGAESTIENQSMLYELLSAMKCRKCGAVDVDIVQGRECIIKDIRATVE